MSNAIVIVSCYGLIDESRSQEEMIGLENYIKELSLYIEKLETKPKAVVFSGGRTAPEVSGESEAESMLRYVIENELLTDQHLLAETTAHNAYEQLVFGLAHVRKLIDDNTSILCICDTPRFEKTSIMANILFGDYFDIEVQAFDRKDIHTNSTREYQLFTDLPESIKKDEFVYLKEYINHVILSQTFED